MNWLSCMSEESAERVSLFLPVAKFVRESNAKVALKTLGVNKSTLNSIDDGTYIITASTENLTTLVNKL